MRSLRNLTFKPGKAERMDNVNSHMAEATAYMAIAISKGMTPWKVGFSETMKVWWSAPDQTDRCSSSDHTGAIDTPSMKRSFASAIQSCPEGYQPRKSITPTA